jgi:hypothetical protein
MIVSVNAIEFAPYLGFWNRLLCSDAFVLADTMRFKHRDFQNRNRIRIDGGWSWITVPVNKSGVFLRDIRVRPWNEVERSWAVLEYNYRDADYWSTYAPEIKRVLGQDRLIDINVELIKLIKDWLGIRTDIHFMSAVQDFPSEDFFSSAISSVKALGGTAYLTGAGNIGMLPDRHKNSDVQFIFQEWANIPYPQVYSGWHPRLSVLDCLLTHGSEYTKRVVQSGWAPQEADHG